MRKRGITLVALVITIVLMLILATVTITGAINGGLFDQTGKAKQSTEVSNEKESLQKAIVMTKSNNRYGNITKGKLQQEIEKDLGENVCGLYEMGDKLRVHFNDTNNWYIIDYDGTINEWIMEEETRGIYIATVAKSTLNLDGAILLSPIQTDNPSTVTNYNYLWSSSNPNVATVSYDGILKCGTELGTTTITCKGANSTESTCQVTTTAKIVYTNNGTTNATANGESASSENPTIPVGYSAINTSGSTWNVSGAQTDVDNGLVIMDNDGNQFVWIPVPNVIHDGTTEITSGTYTPMAVLKNNSTTNYQGILYTFDGATASRLTASNNSEPGALTKSDLVSNDETKGYAIIRKYIKGMVDKTDNEVKTAWTSQLQKEYNALINSTSTYGGFWISRYEFSYDENNNKLASIAGVKSATANKQYTKTWYSFYQKIKDYSTNSNYGSTMLWGSQFDAMSNWFARNGIPVGQNSIVSGSAKNKSRVTGNPSYNDKIKNIFDLYGCNIEWTQECYSYGGGRVERNTSLNGNITARYGFLAPQTTDSDSTSRITLYAN